MRCLDATFLIDLLHEDRDAVRKAEDLRGSGERLSVPAPVLTEVLIGAHFRGGASLRKTLEVLAGFDVLDVDATVAAEAGRLGAEMLRKGVTVTTVDLLIATAARLSQHILVTRDVVFSRIPGLAVEAY
jgi:predicted nucleic acid-binding protein